MSFSQLPEELLFIICEKISSIVDLVNLSVCSKRLNFICKESNLYHCDVYEIKNVNNLKENINNALEFNKNIKLKLDLSQSDILLCQIN